VFEPRDSCWWPGAGSVRCAMTLLSTLLSWSDRAATSLRDGASATLECDLPRKDPGTYQEDGEEPSITYYAQSTEK
jgi:hypothetical protein